MSSAALLTIMRNGETLKSCQIDGEVVLGRGEGCVIRLDDRAVSRLHAVFRPTQDGVQIEGKSSFSPIIVNGAECSKALLKEGDVISIGPYLLRLSNAPTTGALSATASAIVSTDVASLKLVESSQSLGSLGSIDASVGLENIVEEQEADSDVESEPEPESEPKSDPEPIDEDGHTKVATETKLRAKLVFPSGGANCREFDIQQDEVSIGRGSKCDIVLEDKKSSRKHAIIVRRDSAITIKDLESANGTFVNNIRVKEQELSGDEAIRIGDVDFRLELMDMAYAEREKDFLSADHAEAGEAVEGVGIVQMPQPTEWEPHAPLAGSAAVPGAEQVAGNAGADMAGIPGLSGVPGIEPGGKATKKSLIPMLAKINALPPIQRYAVLAGIIAAVWFLFLDEEPEIVSNKAAQKAGGVTARASPGVPVPLAFHSLTTAQKRFIEGQHALAFEHYKNKEYDKALYEIQKIFALVPDYKDSKEIARYAQEGKRKLQALEEERKKKEEEAELRAKMEQLLEEVRALMAKKQYEQVKELMSQILANDPDNQQVAKWKAEIQEYEQALRDEEERKRVQSLIREQLLGTFADGKDQQKQGRCYPAMTTFEKVIQSLSSANSPKDAKLLALAKQGVRACRAWISSKREPLLREAKEKEGSGELSAAFRLYEKASRVDPHHKGGFDGMARIRGVLHERAKVAYTEAVLAESYSDFSTSKKKFKECLEIAPKDDIYYERAQSKLARYLKKDLEEGQQ